MCDSNAKQVEKVDSFPSYEMEMSAERWKIGEKIKLPEKCGRRDFFSFSAEAYTNTSAQQWNNTGIYCRHDEPTDDLL